MLTIENEEEMEKYRRQRVLLSLYLDHAYSREAIATIFEAQEGFNEHVREAWHMLIPYKSHYAVDVALDPKEYGTSLARNIINANGIPHGHLPLLMFEGATRDEPKFYVHFNGRSKADIVRVIGEIGDIAVKEWREGRADAQDFRTDVTNAVRAMLNREKLLVVLGKVAPKVAGVLSAASDLKSLHE